jgi:Na+-translocating ferredoxin:NAD+ oxidoreductase RNF subunit RnfB
MQIAIIIVGLTGAIAAVILYILSKFFEVKEDPRIAQIMELLPGANCGGCGYPGCGGFAEACVKAPSLNGLSCPVAKADVMKKIANLLGQAADESIPQIAVVRCNGTCEVRPRINQYDGAKTCAIASSLYSGETGCSYGCLGWGDCVKVCRFDAIRINPETGIAEVSEEKCVACGVCEKACPKKIIEIRKKGPKSRRIYIACVNRDKGAVARKACQNACIGCNKCLKECTFEAITITQNKAYIDDTKCRLCRKCVPSCPTGAIHELNFPPQKSAAENPASSSTPTAGISTAPHAAPTTAAPQSLKPET